MSKTPRFATIKVRGTWAAPQIAAGKLKEEIEVPTQLFINGEWVDAKSGKTFSTLDPTTETPIVEGITSLSYITFFFPYFSI
jgi:hypothetical protein